MGGVYDDIRNDIRNIRARALGLASVYPAPAWRTVVVDFVVHISAFMVVQGKVWQEHPTGCLAQSARVVGPHCRGIYDGALDAQYAGDDLGLLCRREFLLPRVSSL